MGDPASMRVSKLLLDAGGGVDLDYMGSYDYSDPPTLIGSANRIANAAPRLKVVTRELVLPGHEEEAISFVCTDEQEGLFAAWDEWVKAPHTKEPSGFPADENGFYESVVGWWALGEDLIWSRREEVAENIRTAFVEIERAASAAAAEAEG
jgi:hypothetical protein